MLLLCSSIQRDRRRESLTGLNATAAAKLQAAVIAALVPELLHFQGPLMSLTLTYRAPISISRLCGSRICFSSRRESRSSRSARLLARRCSWCACLSVVPRPFPGPHSLLPCNVCGLWSLF
ncbi:hypothetical protein MARPO_0106s0024 [Marchantia polymorpha]|uniref:Uncharacterized protein n=1 Tax=Marchantia polymorpha TaxID=3197 RepID=A0A2R6WDC3_MARPO|nr:hypothetical protein MARPO_0106s0024 [Marchantia polymorpha]|eukprot:PTQ31824.1 hypothetical protein MARPO_0106s0024 [Marchantia polymorpha]